MDLPLFQTTYSTGTEISSNEKTSLGKMKIAYLLNDELNMQQIKDCAKAAAGEVNINPWSQQQDISTMTVGSLDIGDCGDRVEQWVTSQSFGQSTDLDSSYVRYSKDGTTYGQRPSAEAPLPGPQFVLDETNWIWSGDLASPTLKRSRPRRSGYTRDEKLFIKHARVIGNISWQNISTMFKNLFGSKAAKHTVLSLRGVYYRTRGEWGMDCVTRSGIMQRQSDESIVNMKLSEHAGISGGPRLTFQV
jgi:hypothetical protein